MLQVSHLLSQQDKKTKQGFGVIYDVTMKKTKENMRKFSSLYKTVLWLTSNTDFMDLLGISIGRSLSRVIDIPV